MLRSEILFRPSRVLTFTLCATVAFSCIFVAISDQPKISLSETNVDIGALTKGQTGVYDVTVANTGGATLKIHEIRQSCTCTKSDLDHHLIEAGKTARLRIVVTGNGRKTSLARVALISNAANSAVSFVSVQFRDNKIIDIVPSRIDFGYVRGDVDTCTESVRLRFPDAYLLPTIGGIKYSHDLDDAIEFSDAIEGRDYILNAVLKKNGPKGELVGKCLLYVPSSDKNESLKHSIPVYAYVPSKYFYRPDQIELAEKSATIALRPRDEDMDFRIVSATLKRGAAVHPLKLHGNSIHFDSAAKSTIDADDDWDAFLIVKAIVAAGDDRISEKLRIPLTLRESSR